jgi:hypothetical protein
LAEREVRGEVFNQELKKTEIDKRKRAFLEKGFSTPIRSRKINGISTKITLCDFNFLNHLTSDFINKRRFIHNCLKNLSFDRKTSRIELYVKKRGNNILELRSSKFIQEFDLSILE